MTLTPKEKELAAIGISVAAGCKPCTDHHITVARKTRAIDDEIRQAIENGRGVRATAANIIAAHAFAHLGVEANTEALFAGLRKDRQTALTCIGAAFAVNCTSSLEHHLTAGESGRAWQTGNYTDSGTFCIHKAKGSFPRRTLGWDEKG